MTIFEHGTSYPIETLPDDLHDETIPNSRRWAIRVAMFWNDCQGWWLGHVSQERQRFDFGQSTARFWMPLPPDPMTREQVLVERGMVVCPECDAAIYRERDHTCHQSNRDIVREQREIEKRLS